MLERPKEKETIKVDGKDYVTKYVLQTKLYCPLCEKETHVERMSINSIEWWFVDYCHSCDSFDKTIHERQVMPFCEQCGEHYKFNGNKVVKLIYDTLGKRICNECSKPYLEQLRTIKQGDNEQNISTNSYE